MTRTRTFFTSDTHFGHANIIRYCNRPFGTVDEMDEALIARWNETVGPQDLVYHLGDFAFYRPEKIREIRARLNGEIRLVLGNHDRSSFSMQKCGLVVPGKATTVWLEPFVGAHLEHEPPADGQDWYNRDAWICGHVHDKWRTRRTPGGKWIYNVGVDVRDFRPVTWDQIKERE